MKRSTNKFQPEADQPMAEKINTPTVIVILGATGDLSRRKLYAALLDLYVKGFLPVDFRVVGFSRDSFSNSEFKKFVHKAIDRKKHGHSKSDIKKFLENLSYHQGLFEDTSKYQGLSKILADIDKEFDGCSNKLFYLAVPPKFYEIIFQNLASSSLTIPCGGKAGWTRVLVEKPFGRDIHTAQKLDAQLTSLFKEEQVFRIDHYLAKEAVQNILSFRFSNSLFEKMWNSSDIEKVEIQLFETLGMEGRGSFYSDVGALRDVGQNHILQMLALIAMQNPRMLDAKAIRNERAKVLRALRPIKIKDVVRGQYEGFIKEKGIPADSTIETYFRLKTYIDNKRWKGTPFYLESGKRMSETKIEISIYFKESECLCPPKTEQHHQNVLTFRIQPNEEISAYFWAKKPGYTMELEPKKLSFSYELPKDMVRLPDAYEKVLLDCIRGDQTLFVSSEEVEAAWKFITPIIEGWNETKLYKYKKGTNGPDITINK